MLLLFFEALERRRRITWKPMAWKERSPRLTHLSKRWGNLVRVWLDQLTNYYTEPPLQWRHNEHDGVSNHQPHGCLINRLFRRFSKKTSKFRVTGLCAGNSPVTGEFPAQMASNAENASIRWRTSSCVVLSPIIYMLGLDILLNYTIPINTSASIVPRSSLAISVNHITTSESLQM